MSRLEGLSSARSLGRLFHICIGTAVYKCFSTALQPPEIYPPRLIIYLLWRTRNIELICPGGISCQWSMHICCYLQGFCNIACIVAVIYKVFVARHVFLLLFAMISHGGVQFCCYVQWIWAPCCVFLNICNDSGLQQSLRGPPYVKGKAPYVEGKAVAATSQRIFN